ncbi:calcium-binding protein [Microvirga tunisiensis]|nr:calcium-binding protein [Microvirga tunisiensis]
MAAPEQWSPIFDIGSYGNSLYPITSTAVLRDGWVVVTWLNTTTHQTQYRVLNADGTAFTSEVIVNSSQEKPIEQPNVAALPNGLFMVSYDDYLTGGESNLNLNKYDVFTGIFASNAIDRKNGPLAPVISSFKDGSFNINYNYGVDGSKYYHDAAPSGSDTNGYGQIDGDYKLKIFGIGSVSVDQSSYALLFKQQIDAQRENISINIRSKKGDLIANKLVVTANNSLSEYASVAALSNGNYAVVYVEQSNPQTLKAKIFSAGGILLTPNAIVLYQSDSLIWDPSVQKTSNGGFVFAVCRSAGVVQLGTFSSEGINLFQINGGTSVNESEISTLNDGRFAVTWRADLAIKGQIFDPRTAPVDWTGDDIGQQFAGTKFGDHLRGAGGNDTLFGSAGDDVLNGGDGGDRLDGGAGWDLATYIDTPDAVIIDLSDNSNNGGAAAGDVLIGIESLQGTNQGDTLTSVLGANGSGSELHGAGGGDILKGQNGGDRLYGEEGDDTLEGGAGSDILDVGNGWDLATYINVAGQGVTVDLSNNANNAGGALGDTLVDIEVVQGSNQADTLTSIDRGGGTGAELHGAGGADTLTGKGGGDRLFGEAGNDILRGGAGGDVLDGGADSDTAVFSGQRSAYTITDNLDGTFTVTGLDGTDRLTNIELVKFDDVTETLTPGAENHDPDRLTFLDDSNAASVDADAITPVLGTLKAHDPDTGQTLSYAIDLSDANQGRFTITNGNQLSVASGTLDAGTYTVKVRVSDGHGGALVKDFTIVSNPVVNGNHAPSTLRLNDATQVSINENALFNGTLSASDGDGDTNLTWSFDDSVAGHANSLFEIDNSGTGNKLLKLKAGIDYEALPAGQKYVTVYLKADDGKAGGTSATQAFTIAVADLDETPPNQAPTGVTLSGHAANEYAMAGREVGTLSATDANNDVLSYALLDDAGGRFMLSGNRILVADGFRLDFEQARSHTISVQASDGRGGVTSQDFTIDVGNIDPEFTGGTARNDMFYGGVKNDVLLGNLGNDRLFGGAGNDTLKGEAGNDTLGGGAGLDKLYGTKGATSRDAFVFDTKLTSRSVASKNKDTIVDFGPKYDSIFLDDAAFGNRTIANYLKGKGAGLDHAYKMKSSFFRVGDKALDRDDFFIAKKVKPTEVKLYWDADGSGSKAMLEIGTVKLQKGEGTALTYKDFLFI